MSAVINLLNYFVDKTQEVCRSFSELADFDYNHNISAAVDCQTITVHKVHELRSICGFFTATAELDSPDISFKINYGDIEYGLHYTVIVGSKEYTFTSYLKSVLDMDYKFPTSLRTTESIDKHINEFAELIIASYPKFMSERNSHLKTMDSITKQERLEEEKQATRSEALVAIRRANIHYYEQEYEAALKIYRKKHSISIRH